MLVRGVYLNQHRNTAIVLRVNDDNSVVYLTHIDGPIEVRKSNDTTFTRQWPIFLHDYPLSKAIRSYATSGLKASTSAITVLQKLMSTPKKGKK